MTESIERFNRDLGCRVEKNATGRKTLNEVLAAELDCLRPHHGLYQRAEPRCPCEAAPAAAHGMPAAPASYQSKPEEIDHDLRRLFREIGKWSAARRGAAKMPGEADGAGTTPPKEGGAKPAKSATTAKPEAASPAPLSALCLSGGGIRSATFNLGLLQALARADLLGKFDYLSSVSGGGYIAAWLRTWMQRDGVDDVVDKLKCGGRCFPPLAPEPGPVSALRDYSNYLTPVVGLFSGDSWAAAATILRNLLLNWLVLLPVIGSVVGIPLLFLLFIHTHSWSEPASGVLLEIALGVELIASGLVYSMRRFAKMEGLSQGLFIWTCVFPICAAAGALSAAALGAGLPGDPRQSASWLQVWEFCAVWCIAVPLAGWLAAEVIIRCSKTAQRWAAGIKKDVREDPSSEQLAAQVRSVSIRWEIAALAVSGMAGMCLLVGAVKWWFKYLIEHPASYTVLVLPILLGIYLISRVIFVGIAGRSDEDPQGSTRGSDSLDPSQLRSHIQGNDSDREWWSRLSGWILLVIAGWTVVTGVCLLGCYLPDEITNLFSFLQKVDPSAPAAASAAAANSVPAAASHGPATGPAWIATLVKWIIGALGGVSGVVAALAGSHPRTPASGAAPPSAASKSMTRLLAVAGPLFVVCLIMTLSWSVKAIAETIISSSPLIDQVDPPVPANLFDFKTDPKQDLPGSITLTFLGILVSLGVLGLCASRFVNVNRFSLHGMYRNRLVRAYLGASNCNSAGRENRSPDPFTGFALTDNFPLHKLCEPGAGSQLKARAPLSIINTTLNLVNGEKLAWQQRKAASFSMTPLFCGHWSTGYRSSAAYGGPGGITVGTAIAISGAAANPNMGYCSSPVLGFLMAMFNLRLGAWLGNTNYNGDRTYNHPGPRMALLSLLAEMFGMTNTRSPYVNLSDGGHFDNLGLYETVLRRCRYVFASDAGRDKDSTFEDLGNAIRRIRVDFGIDVEFDTIRILGNERKKHGLYCALGHIRYSRVDGTDEKDDGLLIYIKPTLRGASQIPYDIYSYGKCSSEFPHESTTDQWFNESQFESYRALGLHIGTQLTDRMKSPRCKCGSNADVELLGTPTPLEHFYTAIKNYINLEGCEPSVKYGVGSEPISDEKGDNARTKGDFRLDELAR